MEQPACFQFLFDLVAPPPRSVKRVLPSFRRFIHKCLTVEVEQRQWRRGRARGKAFIFLLGTTAKPLPLFCAGSLTHFCPFTNEFCNIRRFTVAVFVGFKSSPSFLPSTRPCVY